MTNNGEIVNKIMRSGNMHEKEYLVTVNRPVTDAFLHGMANGVPLVELGTTTRKCRVKRQKRTGSRIILQHGIKPTSDHCPHRPVHCCRLPLCALPDDALHSL